jgi:hypothetical protein
MISRDRGGGRFVEGATSVETKIRSPSDFNDRRALMATPLPRNTRFE